MLRLLKNMKQEQLAEEVGLSSGQISNIERGTRDLDTESLLKFAAALGVSPAEFFSDADGTYPARFIESMPSEIQQRDEISRMVRFSMPGNITARERERIEELLENLATLPPEEKDLIYDLIDAVFRRNRKR